MAVSLLVMMQKRHEKKDLFGRHILAEVGVRVAVGFHVPKLSLQPCMIMAASQEEVVRLRQETLGDIG